MRKYISCNLQNYREWESERNMAIVVDGIIGAGKSSIGAFLSEALDMPLFQELKSDDENTLAQRMLDRFYEMPERWSAIIQIMFLTDRFKDLTEIEKQNKRGILDRSIYGDEIFARTIHARGQMSDDEFEIYLSVLEQMLSYVKVPELLIYIDVTIDTALQRIAKRNRSTEGDLIPRDYLEDLRDQYEKWFDAYELSPKLKIDLNESALDEKGQIRDDFKKNLLEKLEILGITKK